MKRKIRMGMVGGGPGSFIGAVHRMAANLDGKIELVCGAFSSDPAKSAETGRELFLPENRVYGSYTEMFEKEKELDASERMDFVAIVTPNHMHFPVADAALDAGFHVVCDKPLALNLDEAEKLEKKVKETGLLFCLTHNYSAYPLVKEARTLVRDGKIGEVRKVIVEYPQGWLAAKIEDSGQKQASWRTDPSKSGISCCMGDIGTHAENLAEYITGLRISELCADLTTFIPGRSLDDDGSVLLRFENGARGILYASQISTGEENPFSIRIYGSKAALEWHQMEPNSLILKHNDRPSEIVRAGQGYLCEAAAANTRLPAGHPEGFIEAFANIYRNFAMTLSCVIEGREASDIETDFPKIGDGVRGMRFIEKVVESSKSQKKWIGF